MNQYSNAELIADMKRHKSLDREDNNRLYELVKVGDMVARQRMIEGNMYLVVDKVDCFLKRHPHAKHLRDDLTSAGFTGLLMAVNAIARGEVENTNVTGYLAVTVGRELENLMDSENPIYVNGRLRRLAREQGYELEIPVVQAMPQDYDKQSNTGEISDDGETQPSRAERSYDPTSMSELRDVLAACCESDEDREFMRMREEGYTQQEIADELGIPKGSVPALRKRLYERFLRKSGMQPR
jgi:RNA polymerase sigma factor (sigma-70 family)